MSTTKSASSSMDLEKYRLRRFVDRLIDMGEVEIHDESELERRLAVSPWLNEDIQNLAFAIHGTPDVQLFAIDGDKHFI